MATQQEFDEATARGDELYRTLPHAVGVRFDSARKMVIIDLNWGYSVMFPPERAQDLHDASSEDLTEVEIAGVWGIYFPRIDADLSVPAIVNGRFGDDRWEAEWAATHSAGKAA